MKDIKKCQGMVKMSESVCIINDYYNSPLVVRAIKSVINYVDKVVIVTSNVNSFSNFPEKPVNSIHFSNIMSNFNELQQNKIENYDIGSDDVGYRYIQGIIHADAEYYFLLDYDDIFLSDKIPTITYLLQNKFDIVKESEFYNPNMNLMKNVIKNNIDWHISQYSFNKFFKNILLHFFSANEIPTNASFDKILFLLGLEHDMKIINKSYTKIIEHANSRTMTMNKRKFYKNTAIIFSKLEDIDFDNSLLMDYIQYNLLLNSFLYEPDKYRYRELTDKYNIPAYKLLYYKLYSIRSNIK